MRVCANCLYCKRLIGLDLNCASMAHARRPMFCVLMTLTITASQLQQDGGNEQVTFHFTLALNQTEKLTFTKNPASECVYDRRVGRLTCVRNHGYANISDIWINSPLEIRYLRMRCSIDGVHRSQCYCKSNNISLSKSAESFEACLFKRLDVGVLSNLTNLEVLDLSDTGLESIQRGALDVLANLKYVAFSYNNIKTLPPSLFCESGVIAYVALSDGALETYPADAFRCKHEIPVRVIELRHNSLAAVPDTALDYLPALERLDLAANPLRNLSKRALSGGKSLRDLDLSACQLSELFPFFCDYLPNIENLQLQNNLFTKLNFESLNNCSSLVSFNLSGNLVTLVSGKVSGLDKLTDLDLSRNKISSLNTSFEGFKSLLRLSLSNNRLSALSEGQFAGAAMLVDLDLGNNVITNRSFKRVLTKPSLRTLLLHENNISQLDNSSFDSLTNLKFLDLSENRVSNLLAGTFTGLHSLETLDLDSNVISSLPNNTFHDMRSLKTLHMHNNAMRLLDSGTFQGLGNLSELLLKKNQLESLPNNVFEPLSSLRTLSLAQNRLSDIEHKSWPMLTTLLLQENNITKIPPDVKFSEMEVFNASHNQITSFFGKSENLFPDFENMVSMDLSHNSIDDMSPGVFRAFFNLTNLNLENNSIHLEITSETFSNAVRLKTLNVAYNSMRLSGSVFSPVSLPNLEVLNMSNNALTDLQQLSEDNYTRSQIRSIDLSHCAIKHVHPMAFKDLLQLAEVNLEHNEIETFPPWFSGAWTKYRLLLNPVMCACNMTWLAEPSITVGNAKVSLSNFEIPNCKIYTETGIYLPHNLKRSQFMCPETDACDSRCTCYKLTPGGNVHVAMCRHKLNEVPELLPPSAKAIFLDGNHFQSPSALRALHGFTNMSAREMYMNGSAISELSPNVFKAFKSLEILHLADNLIVVLPSGVFGHLSLLRQVYLQRNGLHAVHPNVFTGLPLLEELDLSNNRLAVLSAATVRELGMLPAMKYIFLGDNPWVCNCTNMPFKYFVDRVHFKIRDRRRLVCEKGLEITTVSRNKFVCPLNKAEAYNPRSRIIIGTIVAACIFVVLVASGIYFRRELLSLLFAKTGCHIPGKGRYAGKHFDVLVNFDPSEETCSTYTETMLLPLLKNNSFNIQTSCDVIQDIEVTKKLIEDSRCSIFLVDNTFSSNPYLVQVFLAAQRHQQHEKQHKIILLIRGNIDLTALEPEVMSYMRKGNYITANSRMWRERLLYELPDPTSSFQPRSDTADDEDVVLFSALAEDQYVEI